MYHRTAGRDQSGDDCVYELEARVNGDGEFVMGAIHHAAVNADGKIVRFSVYAK